MDDFKGTIYNSEVTFGCNEGFLLLGQDRTVCTQSGDWSNEAPTCFPKCKQLILVMRKLTLPLALLHDSFK